MEATLIYLLLFILLFQLFILVVLTFKPTNTCCKKDCCCEGKKLCECEDTKQEACCKDDMSDCSCSVPEVNEFPSRETTISALGSPENRTKTFRGSPYQDLKDRESLEENDPNIHKK